jgi:hypothetical protein
MELYDSIHVFGEKRFGYDVNEADMSLCRGN